MDPVFSALSPPRSRTAPALKIGKVPLVSPLVVAPMAGMTDSAFRRLVKRNGGCGLVVSEMVSAEGLVRGIDRTLEYAEFTEEERPVAIQIFGGDPDKMAAAARIVEGMRADIVDVNMGCPVPKIAKHHAGCSLMREPEHAAAIIRAMVRAVRIPVTIKMRAGWNDSNRNALDVALRAQDAGAAAVTVHGRTAEQSYSGRADWELVAGIADRLTIPVFGSGDCLEPQDVVGRMRMGVDGVLVGRGVLRDPWILARATDLEHGRVPREVTMEDRGAFLLSYLDLLLSDDVNEASGFRHAAPGRGPTFDATRAATGRARWVVNKLRALCAWYTKGLEGGTPLRAKINRVDSLDDLRSIIVAFFFDRFEKDDALEPSQVGSHHATVGAGRAVPGRVPGAMA